MTLLRPVIRSVVGSLVHAFSSEACRARRGPLLSSVPRSARAVFVVQIFDSERAGN